MKKKELIDKCKMILKKKSLNKSDESFVRYIYELRWGNSKGVEFSIGKPSNHLYNNYNCFLYNGEPFSYKKCIYIPSEEQEHITRVKRAFRTAIDYQIKPLREKGKHVDHIIPFHVLMSDFFIENDIYFSKVDVYEVDVDWFISDNVLLDKWCCFHLKYAKLRVISAKENMRKGREEDLQLYLYRKSLNQTYDRTG